MIWRTHPPKAIPTLNFPPGKTEILNTKNERPISGTQTFFRPSSHPPIPLSRRPNTTHNPGPNTRLFPHNTHHTVNAAGEAGFSFPGGGGVDRALRPDPPPSPKKGSIDRTPKILPRLTPGPPPKIGKKRKWDFLDSARQGGSEKSSFAIYLVKKKSTNFSAQKNFSAPLAPDFIMTD